MDLLSPGADAELSRQVMGVRRMCAAIRASLETHVRSEESELWPLFTEHFSRDEQQYLVGVIIGRTGAQVLQALLPWVSGAGWRGSPGQGWRAGMEVLPRAGQGSETAGADRATSRQAQGRAYKAPYGKEVGEGKRHGCSLIV